MKKLLVIFLVLTIVVSIFSLDYPRKTVSIICPWGAGGGTDRVARFLADELSKEFGVPFVVVNKTGGGGAVGHGAGAYANPDGYTLTLVTLEIATMHWMGLTPLTYEDFDYIAQVNFDPAGLIVKGDSEWNSTVELLVDVAMNPGKYLFSGSGAGTIWDLSRIGMFNAVGIPPDYTVWVPTTGAAPSVVELLGGHVDAITCSIPEAWPQIASGDLKALAIMADERDPRYSNIPTLKEIGIDWSSGTWRGIAVPKGTPQEIKDLLEEKIIKIAHSQAFKDFMDKNGFGIKIRGSQEFTEYVADQDKVWREVLEIGGYLPE
ncbi:twin-arginine translocation pathway signal protein [Petrotoga miotherma DSM 10691]|uniref:Twin-arginine translocation pathway signal protein n=1 Tax=Petrotoga miotherma DSM 10691 TaxID=1434326 RepID=A0A2K1P9V1_9BACT|nr:tripartite tricarboxylate transporter substrate binding protein [Petrotoga miotherma]PNR99585.1 twin-arginine translocation pathway signal protein [Petrotoga miotherma DSM 10691]